MSNPNPADKSSNATFFTFKNGNCLKDIAHIPKNKCRKFFEFSKNTNKTDNAEDEYEYHSSSDDEEEETHRMMQIEYLIHQEQIDTGSDNDTDLDTDSD